MNFWNYAKREKDLFRAHQHSKKIKDKVKAPSKALIHGDGLLYNKVPLAPIVSAPKPK